MPRKFHRKRGMSTGPPGVAHVEAQDGRVINLLVTHWDSSWVSSHGDLKPLRVLHRVTPGAVTIPQPAPVLCFRKFRR